MSEDQQTANDQSRSDETTADNVTNSNDVEQQPNDVVDGSTSRGSRSRSCSPPPPSLTLEIVQAGLSTIARTVDGSALAFSKLVLDGKGLVDVSLLQQYPHIRYLRCRMNNIADLTPITKMTCLTTAELTGNAVRQLIHFPNPYLQVLDVSSNLLQSIDGLFAAKLTYLKLDDNKITSLQGLNQLQLLQRLDINANQLTTMKDICGLPNLQMLQIADNMLNEVTGLDTLPSLEILNIAGNNVTSLEPFRDKAKSLRVRTAPHEILAA